MKFFTRKTTIKYQPCWVDDNNQTHPYFDGKGKPREYKRMKAAKAFINKQTEKRRFVAENKNIVTVYTPS